MPDYPPVKLYFRETTAFQLGVSDFHLEEGSIWADGLEGKAELEAKAEGIWKAEK